ncbi:hypothetical protein BU23DRAFT_456868 [Bimuria novae-zelandiae CBS 107.79]|uniref:Dystroglycan-type cadherin-like domain-containing protein n=1 Tax=Bimuria novae-zelandiae CBS 107.79 TaxID=1447943 RepID=A0A6A5VGQ1_9PLEO|nr:hypothetical protein BU23DRAFT_456868 [Bimuria novae-zelandiae CBS 107.79]
MLLAASICLLTTVVATSPQVNFPLKLQLPPVARVGEAYSFQFAATTFQPNPDQLVYSIASGPSWLHIHSENRTLWGTPETKDAGTATFTITAAGEAGAVANMETQLPVENDDGPKSTGNISQALAKAGQLSGPQSITLLPLKPFEIVLGQDIFQANGKKLSYRTTLSDHTPLPSWISFDAQSLRFAGTTPSSASPQSFHILLIATDSPDYAAATIAFSIVVSSHLLLFTPMTQTVNVSKGQNVDIKGLKDMLSLDHAPIHDEDIDSATADLPSWLSFDTHSFDITGNPPSGLMKQDISVVVQDKFGDSAAHSIHLSFMSQLFTGEIGRLNITPGVHFEYGIPKSILTLESESVSLEFGKLNKWLSFDSESLTISGTIPADTVACSVEGSMTATSLNGKMKDTKTFQIEVLGSSNRPSNPLNSGTGTKEHSDNATPNTASSSRKNIGVIIGAVLASLFGTAVIIILALSFCRQRKKQEQGYISPSTPRSPRKANISRPIPQDPIVIGWGEIDRLDDEDPEKGKLDDSPPRTVELLSFPQPPKFTVRKPGHFRDVSLNEQHYRILSFDKDVFSLQAVAKPAHHPYDSMKMPTDMLRRNSAGSPSQNRLHTTTVFRNSTHRSSGVPVDRCLTGFDHGRHTHAPSHSTNFSAAQRTLSSSSGTTALSTVPSAFPQASKARHITQFTTPLEKRQSIRPVVPSVFETLADPLLDRRPMDEKRHSYIRKRASAQQSPLFSSRVSSSTFQSPPSFIGESSPAPKSPLATLSPNIVRPDDSILSLSNDVPESLHIRRPADTPSPASNKTGIPKSLRKHRPTKGFARKHTVADSVKSVDEVEKRPARPETVVYAPTGAGTRSSTYASLRSADLMKGLNKETNTEIWNDAEISESNYSGDEDDIEEGHRRATLELSTSVAHCIAPLFDSQKKRTSKRTSKALKKTSERDPTPFHLRSSTEHSGKENLVSSLHSLRDSGSPKTTSPSPTRPKTSAGYRPKVHSRKSSQTLALVRAPSTRTTSRPLPRIPSTKERHSRKSLHSRSQSRHSNSLGKKERPCERSRT